MNDGHLLVAFHGCDITTRDDLVAGRTRLRPSANRYDWLGGGFYLFEGDPERARAFATAVSRSPERRLSQQPVVTPAVVGCLLSVQRCLDMTTRPGLLEFSRALRAIEKGCTHAQYEILPTNSRADDDDADVLLRRLDNAVIAFIHAHRERHLKRTPHYQVVRGAFRQGPELAQHSGFHRDSNIQLAVRENRCVRGWFLLPGDALLPASDYARAKQAMSAARARFGKPRRRA